MIDLTFSPYFESLEEKSFFKICSFINYNLSNKNSKIKDNILDDDSEINKNQMSFYYSLDINLSNLIEDRKSSIKIININGNDEFRSLKNKIEVEEFDYLKILVDNDVYKKE